MVSYNASGRPSPWRVCAYVVHSNAADLRLLEKMGCRTDMQGPKKRVSLRAVASMVLATVRMERLRQSWVRQERQLVKTADKMRSRELKVKERASAA